MRVKRIDDAEKHGSFKWSMCPWMLNEDNLDPNLSLLIYAEYILEEIPLRLLADSRILV